MRNKTSLVLMEQLVMVLVFALAAAICLQIFVLSDRLSKEQEVKAHAAFLAQNAAEWIKNQGSEGLRSLEGAEWQPEDASYKVIVQEETTDISGLVRARIAVSDGAKILFEIPVAWQEVTVRE